MFNPFQKIPSATPEDVSAEIHNSGVGFIDVRAPLEYAHGHARGAINIPLGDVEESIDTLRAYRAVYVICQSGGRSAQATSLLIAKGIPAINVAGGTLSWRSLGLPIE